MFKYVTFSLIFLSSLFVLAAEPIQVRFETNRGSFDVELNSEKAPITVQNFLSYVDSGFYSNTLFHRTVKNFVVQGGGLNIDMVEKPTNPPIQNEATNGLSNLKGSIAMAREDAPDSATAQFYFNVKDNVGLNHQEGNPNRYGYAVFGKVVRGMEVVEAMQNVEVQTIGEYEDVPVQPIIIQSVERQ